MYIQYTVITIVIIVMYVKRERRERRERERDGDVAIVDRRSSSSSCRFHLDGGIDSTSRRLSSCGDN
jgi:hypothetical protein